MRILWIEDNEKISHSLVSTWFGEFEKNHDIKRFYTFSKSHSYISNNINDFDFVILDMNLENDLNIDTNNFPRVTFPLKDGFSKEAGFHLYLHLFYSHFPIERVIFLTNDSCNLNYRYELVQNIKNAYQQGDSDLFENNLLEIQKFLDSTQKQEFEKIIDNDIEDLFSWLKKLEYSEQFVEEQITPSISERFQNARLFLPTIIQKGVSCKDELQSWLAERCTKSNENQPIFDYLTLRRGILDVIQLIENNHKIVVQTKFENMLDKTSFLEGLKWQVRDFNLATNPHKSVYFAICDYVSKPFETFNWGKDISNFSVQPEIIPLYFLRNWTAHGLIFGSEKTVLNAQITGLAFLWAMKSIFNVEEYGHQNELKRLFSSNSNSYNTTLSKEDALKEIYKRGFKSYSNWQQENYVSHCYASYLLASQNNSSELKTLTESVYEEEKNK